MGINGGSGGFRMLKSVLCVSALNINIVEASTKKFNKGGSLI